MASVRDPSAVAGLRVLIVEDEYFLADDIAGVLRQLGAEIVGPSPTLGDALAHLSRAEPIDVAILDINLHGEMCYEVADALLARDIPFVFATGYDIGMVPSAYGTVPHWQKPFDAAALARALPTLLNRP